MSLSFVRRAAVLCAGVVLAATACGSSDDDPSAGGSDTPAPTSAAPSTEPTSDPTTEPPADPSEPPAETPAETPAAPPAGGSGSPETTDAAITRFETFLHALGAADVPTMCAIAGPAAAQAEADGFGPCESTMAIMATLPSAEQLAALETATVDPELVDDSTPGQVTIPIEAVVANASFSEEELGDTVLAYQDGDWFIVD